MSSSFRLLSAAVVALALAACASKAKVREPVALVPLKSPSVKLEAVWSRSIGRGAGGRPSGIRPHLESDALFVAEVGGRVAALDPATGAQRWVVKTKSRLVSGPAVVGELVIVGTLDANVIALKRADGREAWRAKVSSEVLAPPAGDGGVVVIRAGDGRIYGLDASNGQSLWSFDRNEPTLTLRGLSTPLIAGNRVYVGTDAGHLLAVNLRSGEALWDQLISAPNGRTELDRLVDVDADPQSSLYGVLVASYGGDVELIDETDGEPRWKRAIKSNAGIAIGGSNVYVSDADGVVWALDLDSGAASWKNEQLKYRRLSPPAYFRGHVVVADYQGYLHFLDGHDGSFVGRMRVGSDPIAAPMVATEDRLILQNVEGKLVTLAERK